MLSGKNWDLFAIFDLESRFDSLVERFSIARTAVALISDWIGKIIAVDVSEVVLNRNFRISDVIAIFVILLIFLNFFEHLFELLIAWGSEILSSSK